ncbi:MAG: lipopolysaccharide biosynthesis protein [Desulfobacterales bacterium]|jgi:O-antigen/teichoic acid export membrane protein|nr:lipopolysaccharide biosynthesis protein [Desulfobacterales bacterium]
MALSGDNLSKQMQSSAAWLYIQGAIQACVQFGAGIVLARILSPSDFGVFYAATAFSAIMQKQVVLGIPVAFLQAKSVSKDQWDSAFWVMEAMAVICTLLIFIASGFLQHFYDDTRFTLILQCMCVNFFILPYMSINGSILRRKLDYRTISRIQIIVSFISIAISIALAYVGFGPYCLVISGILSSLFSTILMSFSAPWKPLLAFAFSKVKPLMRFGFIIHLNNSIGLFADRVDNMMIGSMLGAGSLGIYNRAYNLARMPVVEITSRLYQLFFTGLSKIQHDINHSVRMFHKILCAMALVVFPFLVIFTINADAFIATLYGDKWLPAAVPLKVMALGSFFIVISTTMGALATAQNLIIKETPIVVFKAVSTVLIVFIFIRWGLTGISAGIAIRAVLIVVLMQRMLMRSHLKLKIKDIVITLAPAITASAIAYIVAGVVGYGLTGFLPSTSPWHFLLISFFVFSVYLGWLLIYGRYFSANIAFQACSTMFIELYSRMTYKLFNVKP